MPFPPWRRTRDAAAELPLPPPEMRALVGPTDARAFDNTTGEHIVTDLRAEQFARVLDFGCGCGRLARMLIQQTPRPERYEGLDLHAGMIRWATENLAPHAPGFRFTHHDVRYDGFNPGDDKPWSRPLPFEDDAFTLIIAHSVFTHLTQSQAEADLAELARVLAPGGVLHTTWFLFEKRDFPMMQEDQNTLFINEYDLRNAVVYDRDWVRRAVHSVGLRLSAIAAPEVHGHQWVLRFVGASSQTPEPDWPADDGPVERRAPPLMPAAAHRIGHR